MGIVDKSELIAAIRSFNHSAKAEFLQRFSESELRAYLERIRTSSVVFCAPCIVPPRTSLYFR
jgi:hypothetical protein